MVGERYGGLTITVMNIRVTGYSPKMTQNFFHKHGIPNVSLIFPEHVRKKFDPLGLHILVFDYAVENQDFSQFLKKILFLILKKPILHF